MSLLKRIQTSAHLNARRPVLGLLEGEYASRAGGRGGDFHDLREYVPGDDLRDLDWKATARRGEPLVRRYVAERKHTVMFLIRAGRQLSANANLTQTKRELAVTLTGMLGWLAVRHGDYVGALIGDGGLTAHRPVLTEVGLERILTDLDSRCSAGADNAELATVLEHAVGLMRGRNLVVVVSDTAPLSEQEQQLLRRLHTQHEVFFVAVGDLNPAEAMLESTGRTLLDVDHGTALPRFLARAGLAREVTRLDERQRGEREQILSGMGIASVQVDRVEDAPAAVFSLLRRSRHVR